MPGYRQESFGSNNEFFRDQWGVVRQLTSELIAYPVEPAIKTDADLLKWRPPDPDLDLRYVKIREMVKEYKGKKAIIATFADPFDVAGIPQRIQHPWVDTEPDRLAGTKHAAMIGEQVACFGETRIGRRHWIEPTDSITYIRGIYPPQPNGSVLPGAQVTAW